MGKIIILGSEKGGVAKTTSTFNLAYALAKEGKKVLAVDFDSQANLSTCFGIENTAAVPVTVGHLMMHRIEDEELPDASEYIQSRNGVDFISSSIIVKEGLPDAEAYVYVIETNMLQRSFNDLSVSERIAVLAERYDKVCGTKKREEILAELQTLNGGGGHNVHQQAKSREIIGKELGLTGRHIARYVRCKELIPEFKDMLDDGSLTMGAAVELSYLPEKEQTAVKKVMDQNCIRLKANKAGELRKAAGNLSEGEAQKILGVDRPVKPDAEKPVSVKLPAKLYSRYFSDVAAKDVQGILEAALELYFERKGA